MTVAPLHFAGEQLALDPAGALYWPAKKLLAVSDLHLEKGSAAARRGMLLPPWDSAVTLERLALLLKRYRPRTVIALGDSFHDRQASARLQAKDAARLAAMTRWTQFVWVLGNHDPKPTDGLSGEWVEERRIGPIVFRHEAKSIDEAAEICGHHHPKATVAARGGEVTRPCFVAGQRRIMLPAFGAYTGGLDVRGPPITQLFKRNARVFLLGRERLFSFPL